MNDHPHISKFFSYILRHHPESIGITLDSDGWVEIDLLLAQAQKHGRSISRQESIGHVPFKEKDKMFKEYHETLDKLYKTLNIKASNRRMDNFRNNLKKVVQRGENAIDNERGRLVRRFEQLKQDINTYENNLGFLSISSKKGNNLIDDMNRRVQKLKDELEEIKQKIKTIDAERKD